MSDLPRISREIRLANSLALASIRTESAAVIRQGMTAIYTMAVLALALAIGCWASGSWSLDWGNVISCSIGLAAYWAVRMFLAYRRVRKAARRYQRPSI